MSDTTFEKVDANDQPMYGPRALLLCGFSSDAQHKFVTLLKMLGLERVPRIWASEADQETGLDDLLALPADSGTGTDSSLPRAVIMSGFTQKELHRLIGGSKQAGMRQALWAALTPVSEKWSLGALLKELAAEQQAMMHKKR